MAFPLPVRRVVAHRLVDARGIARLEPEARPQDQRPRRTAAASACSPTAPAGCACAGRRGTVAAGAAEPIPGRSATSTNSSTSLACTRSSARSSTPRRPRCPAARRRTRGPRGPRARAKSDTSLIGVPHAALTQAVLLPDAGEQPEVHDEPRMPLSATSRFVPPPRRNTGIPASAAGPRSSRPRPSGCRARRRGPRARRCGSWCARSSAPPTRTTPNALIFAANSRTFATRKIVPGGRQRSTTSRQTDVQGSRDVELRLFNTMGRRVETFVPLEAGEGRHVLLRPHGVQLRPRRQPPHLRLRGRAAPHPAVRRATRCAT